MGWPGWHVPPLGRLNFPQPVKKWKPSGKKIYWVSYDFASDTSRLSGEIWDTNYRVNERSNRINSNCSLYHSRNCLKLDYRIIIKTTPSLTNLLDWYDATAARQTADRTAGRIIRTIGGVEQGRIMNQLSNGMPSTLYVYMYKLIVKITCLK